MTKVNAFCFAFIIVEIRQLYFVFDVSFVFYPDLL